MTPGHKFPVVMVQDAPTRVQFSSLVLEKDKWVRLGGGQPGRHRKCVYITNEDNDHKISIFNGDGEDPDTTKSKGVVIWVNTTAVFFTSADLYVKATAGRITDGATLDPGLLIMEVFYI